MDEVKNRKTIFRVIKTYPTEDCIATYEYEGTIEDLCIELSKYLGGKKTRYRRMMERWLHEYSVEHPALQFKVWNTSTKAWQLYVKKVCRTSK